jgi:riboflavin kinase/FMN adenylyltransferase
MYTISGNALEKLDFPRGTVVTIGVFDGVHAGHRRVIDKLSQTKRAENAQASILITFDRHPLDVISPDTSPKLITTLEEKIKILEGLGIDKLVIQKFDRRTARVSYISFISDVLVGQLNIKHLIVGYDFHMGRGGEGSVEKLKKECAKNGFGLTVVPPARVDGIVVSSSKIREAVRNRNLRWANKMLPGSYFFDARVTEGEGLGRSIGFPTANLQIESEKKLLPPDGVYAARVVVSGKWHDGMMNIGYSPTFHGEGERRMEVNIFDFTGKLYGEVISVYPVKFIRDEINFKHSDRLRRQLQIDKEKTVKTLKDEKLQSGYFKG